MSLFNRKKSAPAKQVSTLIEVRSMYGVSIHVVDTAAGDNLLSLPALCGYTNWVESSSTTPVTAEHVRQTLPHQHAGWKWCGDCAQKVLSA